MKLNNLLIRQLDKSFNEVRVVLSKQKNSFQWINTIRKALCMTTKQLATRLGITQQAITNLEQSEKEGTITLNSLKNVAQALNCKLYYILVPDETLENMIEKASLKKSLEIYKTTNHTMLLEGQEVSQEETKIQIKELAEEIKRNSIKEIWNK